VLAERKYIFDATTLPTYIGPVARMYYFWQSDFDEEEKAQRSKSFGSIRDGLRPCGAYWWAVSPAERVLEIPVTTIPILRLPFHLSYLIYLGKYSFFLMLAYLEMAMLLCKTRHIEPSFLLHPHDLLGGDEVPELRFFPGMDLSVNRKIEMFHAAMKRIRRHFNPIDITDYANLVATRDNLKTLKA